jgi:hypothetical protein
MIVDFRLGEGAWESFAPGKRGAWLGAKPRALPWAIAFHPVGVLIRHLLSLGASFALPTQNPKALPWAIAFHPVGVLIRPLPARFLRPTDPESEGVALGDRISPRWGFDPPSPLLGRFLRPAVQAD